MTRSNLAHLKNIGPKTERWLNALGLYARDDLAAAGPVPVFMVLRREGYPVSSVLLYALQGALMGMHWHALPKDLKRQLQEEADAYELTHAAQG